MDQLINTLVIYWTHSGCKHGHKTLLLPHQGNLLVTSAHGTGKESELEIKHWGEKKEK